MQLRHEIKYFISYGEYLVLRDKLMAAMPMDDHAIRNLRGYHIRSLYFDDINNSAMWEKMDGVQDRQKYRIRIYNLQDSPIHLENKMKFTQMTAKASCTLTRELTEDILAGDWTRIPLGENPVLDGFYAQMRAKVLRPVVIVDYFREAYVYPVGNVRITFDKDLHTGVFSHDLFSGRSAPVPVLEPGQMILEVKYDNVLPPHIQGIINTCNGQRSAISKYSLCRRFH